MTELRAGIAFPFRVVDGRLARSLGSEKLAEDLRHLLATRTGERPMLRSYGGALHHYRQAPDDATLRSLFKHEIEQAIRVFMPEIRLVAPIEVSGRDGEVRVVVHYASDVRSVAQRVELRLG